jgi:hypothetical protein
MIVVTRGIGWGLKWERQEEDAPHRVFSRYRLYLAAHVLSVKEVY